MSIREVNISGPYSCLMSGVARPPLYNGVAENVEIICDARGSCGGGHHPQYALSQHLPSHSQALSPSHFNRFSAVQRWLQLSSIQRSWFLSVSRLTRAHLQISVFRVIAKLIKHRHWNLVRLPPPSTRHSPSVPSSSCSSSSSCSHHPLIVSLDPSHC